MSTKTGEGQTVLPSAETAAMLFWALLASGHITMRKVDGWHTLAEKPTPYLLTEQPDPIASSSGDVANPNFHIIRDSTLSVGLGDPVADRLLAHLLRGRGTAG